MVDLEFLQDAIQQASKLKFGIAMKIAEAAALCGLSADTIRYYEKSGLLPEISRGRDGHRRFTKYDIDWMTLLYWLRETGMPLKQMIRFTRLAKSDGGSIAERREILLAHQQELKQRRSKLEKCEEVLAAKLATYGPLTCEEQK